MARSPPRGCWGRGVGGTVLDRGENAWLLCLFDSEGGLARSTEAHRPEQLAGLEAGDPLGVDQCTGVKVVLVSRGR